jgi:hypothetical protein
MNIREMIEALESITEEYGDEVDVRVADQPAWPFEYEIGQVEAVDLSKEECEVCRGTGFEDRSSNEKCENCDGTGIYREEGSDAESEMVVYISTANQIGYLPSPVTEALGWGRE